ncbi:hypothetical protein [Paractinoplanes ferrugineus]|uniref:Uncharacterized protein n=1 Tax=Paractinoplanes ferrugineus TaxID=113564 RepID=A0A919J429_9ACTN|nr:hypothetical protein [Actinoplanes ferrugineus]GIE12144.1 hypothetical protein Afe05nite_39840 [Actinoplanes ferrugineus]
MFRRKVQPPAGTRIAPTTPAPQADWSDDERIRAEWPPGQLDGTDGARLGWSNGMALYERGPTSAQLLNVAEYLTRGLAYTYLGKPLITDDQAAETVRRILHLIAALPTPGPPIQDVLAARLTRLALAVTRRRSWQPPSLGGDGSVSDDLLRAPAIVDAVAAPGVARNDNLRHFFAMAA